MSTNKRNNATKSKQSKPGKPSSKPLPNGGKRIAHHSRAIPISALTDGSDNIVSTQVSCLPPIIMPGESSNYEFFKFRKLVVRFTPSGGGTVRGTLGIALRADPLSKVLQHIEDFRAVSHSVISDVSRPIRFSAVLQPGPFQGWFKCPQSGESHSISHSVCGFVDVISTGVGLLDTSPPASFKIGWLEFDYDIEFKTVYPQPMPHENLHVDLNGTAAYQNATTPDVIGDAATALFSAGTTDEGEVLSTYSAAVHDIVADFMATHRNVQNDNASGVDKATKAILHNAAASILSKTASQGASMAMRLVSGAVAGTRSLRSGGITANTRASFATEGYEYRGGLMEWRIGVANGVAYVNSPAVYVILFQRAATGYVGTQLTQTWFDVAGTSPNYNYNFGVWLGSYAGGTTYTVVTRDASAKFSPAGSGAVVGDIVLLYIDYKHAMVAGTDKLNNVMIQSSMTMEWPGVIAHNHLLL